MGRCLIQHERNACQSEFHPVQKCTKTNNKNRTEIGAVNRAPQTRQVGVCRSKEVDTKNRRAKIKIISPSTGPWVGLGNGLNGCVSAGSGVGCTLIPPGPVPLGVKNERTPDSVVVALPEAKEASDDNGTDDPVVPSVISPEVGACVNVADELATEEARVLDVALALEVALAIEDVAEDTFAELKLELSDKEAEEDDNVEPVAFALSVLNGSADDWA